MKLLDVWILLFKKLLYVLKLCRSEFGIHYKCCSNRRCWLICIIYYEADLRTKRTSVFQSLLKSSSKIIRDLIKLQSVPAVAKFYLSGTCTNMSNQVHGKRFHCNQCGKATKTSSEREQHMI